MRVPNGLRTVLLIAPSLLLLCLAILTFVLERTSRSFFTTNLRSNWGANTQSITATPPGATTTIRIPTRIKWAPTTAISAVSVLAFVLGALAAFGMWEVRRVQGSAQMQRAWSWGVMVCGVVSAGVTLGVFGWVSAEQGSIGWRGYADAERESRAFAREAWACEIQRWFPGEDWAGSACGTAKAARFLLIVMAVASFLILVSLWVLVRGRGGVKWFFGGKGRYAGFEDAYEMQPGGPPVPYAGPPVQQWAPQPYYAAQPVQQWAPYPVQQVQQVPKIEAPAYR